MNEYILNESIIKEDLNKCLNESQEAEYIDEIDAVELFEEFRNTNSELFERLAQ